MAYLTGRGVCIQKLLPVRYALRIYEVSYREGSLCVFVSGGRLVPACVLAARGGRRGGGAERGQPRRRNRSSSRSSRKLSSSRRRRERRSRRGRVDIVQLLPAIRGSRRDLPALGVLLCGGERASIPRTHICTPVLYSPPSL